MSKIFFFLFYQYKPFENKFSISNLYKCRINLYINFFLGFHTSKQKKYSMGSLCCLPVRQMHLFFMNGWRSQVEINIKSMDPLFCKTYSNTLLFICLWNAFIFKESWRCQVEINVKSMAPLFCNIASLCFLFVCRMIYFSGTTKGVKLKLISHLRRHYFVKIRISNSMQ